MGATEKLPVQDWGLHDVPAIPRAGVIKIGQMLLKLNARSKETGNAMEGLSVFYTIGEHEATAKWFMYGKPSPRIAFTPQTEGVDAGPADPSQLPPTSPPEWDEAATARNDLLQLIDNDPDQLAEMLADESYFKSDMVTPPAAAGESQPEPQALPFFGGSDPLTKLSLTEPEQFAMPWTTFQSVYQDGLTKLLPKWAASLTDADAASAQFWPTIAQHGLAYDLLILEKIKVERVDDFATKFGDAWTDDLASTAADGLLYAIDLTLFTSVEPQTADGLTRFTPATITLLQQDPLSKMLTPVAIRVSGHDDGNVQIYQRGQATDAAWLYALQAAKTSVTVFGIWLGHVYPWHIVSAAMLMTLEDSLPPEHPVAQLLAPQSDYLIAFDTILLILWSRIAPPTSISTRFQFLELINTYARGRAYFDDDPPQKLQSLGLDEEDFSIDAAWDRYPIVGQQLRIWQTTTDYVNKIVDASYADDAAVAVDAPLQKWLREAADPQGGNIRGLPEMNTKEALKRVLTSLVYRLTVHGASRLSPAANPGLTFVANFPPCLQDAAIPQPTSEFDTATLLKYMPTTGVLGKIATFYFTFVFSTPYRSFIPPGGVGTELFFPDGPTDPRNVALIDFRNAIIDFVHELYGPDQTPELGQWPMNIET